jgi:hypothetical protein
MRKILTIFGLLCSLFLIFGCASETVYTEESYLDSEGYLVYKTNYPDYCGNTFYNATTSLTSGLSSYLETNVSKVSGYSKSMYGIYFNYSDTSNYCCVVINTEGSYRIIKIVSGTVYYWDGSSAWTTTATTLSSSNIVQGYSKINVIRVTVTASDAYQLSFNGSDVMAFNTTSLSANLGKGYIFAIDTEENEGFTDSYIQLRWKEIYAL